MRDDEIAALFRDEMAYRLREEIATRLITELEPLPAATLEALGRGLQVGREPGEPLSMLGGAFETLAAFPSSTVGRLQLQVALHDCACAPDVVELLAATDEPPWPAIHAAVAAVEVA
jgi:hypothetical protein